MKTYFLLLALVISSTSCDRAPRKLDYFPEINQAFSASEIQDLTSMLNFFHTSICKSEKLDGNNINECYSSYFKRIKNTVTEKGSIDIQITHLEQKAILNEIDTATPQQIWSYGTESNRTNQNDLSIPYKQIFLRTDGKYAIFLKNFGNTNRKAKVYHDKLMAIGDLSPAMVSDIIINYKEYDIEDKRMQLLMAIHYLTLNEQDWIREEFGSYK